MKRECHHAILVVKSILGMFFSKIGLKKIETKMKMPRKNIQIQIDWRHTLMCLFSIEIEDNHQK